MRARSLTTSVLLLAVCAGCTATGVHRTHSLRLHGGTNFPAEDVVEDLSTGTATDKTWGVEYVYQPQGRSIGVEVGAFQSFADGDGTNTLPGLGLGDTQVEKKMNEMHLGLHYPFDPLLGIDTELGFGLAYFDTTIDSDIDGGSSIQFQDQSFGAYVKASGMVPITDSVGAGLDVRFVAPFENFRDEQNGIAYDANLRQLQVTLFVALSW